MKYNMSLDGLRAVAVMIVMIAHAGAIYPRSGGLGVDIFFVLSGFLITTILIAEKETFGSINFRFFYVKRLLRLAPCLIAASLVYWLVYFFLSKPTPDFSVLTSLTYTSNWARAIYGYDLGWLNHTWSLAIEEQFYLLWPLVVVLLERSSKSYLAKAYVLFALGVFFAVYRAVMVGEYSAARIYFGLDTHMDGLVIGSALAYYVMFFRGSGLVYPSFLFSRLLVPVVAVGLAVMIYFITWSDPSMGLFGFFFAAMGSAFFVFDLSVSPSSPLKNILENRLLVYLGRISYGLYLWHMLVYNMVNGLHLGLGWWPEFAIKFLLSVFVAIISFQYYESKFLVLKKNFSHPSVGSLKKAADGV